MNNFKNVKNSLNLIVFHCYYILFTKDGFTKNIGNFIILSILIIYFFSRNFFFVKGYDLFKSKIIKILKSHNINSYINDNKSRNHTINNIINNNVNHSNQNIDTKTIDESINPNKNNSINLNSIKNK